MHNIAESTEMGTISMGNTVEKSVVISKNLLAVRFRNKYLRSLSPLKGHNLL